MSFLIAGVIALAFTAGLIVGRRTRRTTIYVSAPTRLHNKMYDGTAKGLTTQDMNAHARDC